MGEISKKVHESRLKWYGYIRREEEYVDAYRRTGQHPFGGGQTEFCPNGFSGGLVYNVGTTM